VARTLTQADSSLLRGGWAVGVDGSMDYNEHMELLLFYVAAAAYTCPFRVGGNSGVLCLILGVCVGMILWGSARLCPCGVMIWVWCRLRG